MRDEDFPIAIAAHAHCMTPAIPEIEVANDADALCVWREHDKADSFDAFMRHRVGAELIVEVEVIAFAEQVEIEIGQDRRETIGILKLNVLVVELGPQLVMLEIGDRAGK